VPAAFGALVGWMLGVDKTTYLVLNVVAAVGGYLAGLEHDKPIEGAIRGVIGGTIFGGALLLVHKATGQTPKTKLPHPEIILLAITLTAGGVLGASGARRRANHVEKEGPEFDLRRVHSSELVGFAGSAILFGSLFLPWWSTSCGSAAAAKFAKAHAQMAGICNPNSKIGGKYGDFTAFTTYHSLQWLLLAACIAPFVLAYIIARGHELTWRPGEVTMIVGIVAAALILINGIIFGKPGSNIQISFEPGYFVALVGAVMISVGGFVRQAMLIRSRKPPGVL
jgi:hypothetical protein